MTMRRRSFNTAMICARIPSENEIGALNCFISDYYIISNHLCEGMSRKDFKSLFPRWEREMMILTTLALSSSLNTHTFKSRILADKQNALKANWRLNRPGPQG